MKVKVTRNEFIIMRSLWRTGEPLTVDEMFKWISENYADRNIKRGTIKTYIQRLQKKELMGVLEVEGQQRYRKYIPLVTEEEIVRAKQKLLADELGYPGETTADWIIRTLQEGNMSEEQLARIKKIIEDK